MENISDISNDTGVSKGSLRVARRFLVDFFEDRDLPKELEPLCADACRRFRTLEEYHESLRTGAKCETRPVLTHALELWHLALKHADSFPAFIQFLHQSAEDLGVTRQDCIRLGIWRQDTNP